MVPLNSFAKTGMRVAFHSDFTMAPAQPLLLAWAAATRITDIATHDGRFLLLLEDASGRQSLALIENEGAAPRLISIEPAP